MIRIYNAAEKNMDELVSLRLEMLREVNGLAEDYSFSEKFIADSRAYFENGDQTTLIAVDGEAVACASICYVNVMPTFEHQTGKNGSFSLSYEHFEHCFEQLQNCNQSGIHTVKKNALRQFLP